MVFRNEVGEEHAIRKGNLDVDYDRNLLVIGRRRWHWAPGPAQASF
jgi:hypothetical protein